MDMTAIGVMVFALLKVAIWLGLIGLGIYLGRKIWLQLQLVPSQEGESVAPTEHYQVFWHNRYHIGGWVMLFFAAVFFTQIEAAYRPKTVVQPDNPVLEQQLREIDRTAAPVIQPAQGDLRDAANANYSEQNAQDNASAREQFMTLPEAKD